MFKTPQYSWITLLGILLLLASGCHIEDSTGPLVPEVRIVSPASSTVGLDSVFIQVAADDDKGITKVEIYIDGSVPYDGTLLYDPYIYTWDTRSLPDGSEHTIYAMAYNIDGHTATSGTVKVVTARFMPTALTATQLNDTVASLQWTDNSSVETGFELVRIINDTGYALMKLPPNTTSTLFPGLYLTGESIKFAVRAVKDSIKSKFSNTAGLDVYLFPPGNLTISALTSSSAHVAWGIHHTFETMYDLEENVNNGPFTNVASVGYDTTSIVIHGTFLTGTPYGFRMRSRSRYNTSIYSGVMTVRVNFPAPGRPAVTHLAPQSIRLDWIDKTTFEEGFAIERQVDSASFTESARVDSNVTTWEDASLNTAHQYTYRIRAFSDIDYSDYSPARTTSYGPYYETGTVMSGNTGRITSLSLNHDESLVASASTDGEIRIWRYPAGSLRSTVQEAGAIVRAVSFSPDGSILASADGDSSISLWNSADGSLVRRIPSPGAYGVALRFAPDGSEVFEARSDGTVRCWRIADGTLARSFSSTATTATSLAVSSDGTLTAAGYWNGTVRVWQTSDGALLASMNSYSGPIAAVAFTPGGTTLTTGGNDGRLLLWRLPTGILEHTIFTSPNALTSIGYSPDGTLLAVTMATGGLTLLRVSDFRILEQLQAPAGSIAAFDFGSTSNEIVTGGSDMNVYRWTWSSRWLNLP